MTSLNISNNQLVGKKGTGKFKTLEGQELRIAQMLGRGDQKEIMEPDFSGVVTLADAIRNNGAMKSLDISANRLEAEGAKHIAAALSGCK